MCMFYAYAWAFCCLIHNAGMALMAQVTELIMSILLSHTGLSQLLCANHSTVLIEKVHSDATHRGLNSYCAIYSTAIPDKVHYNVTHILCFHAALLTRCIVVLHTGLDSFTASEVMEVVKGLVTSGITIAATIHSPTPRTFQLFDRVLILQRGRIVFFGDNGESAKQYFAVSPHFEVCIVHGNRVHV